MFLAAFLLSFFTISGRVVTMSASPNVEQVGNGAWKKTKKALTFGENPTCGAGIS